MDRRSNDVWYVRRGRQRRGPYDTRRLERYMLLGRIREGDEVSADGRRWERLDATHPLYPSLLRDAVTPEGFERLVQARQRIDERRPSPRRRVIQGGMRPSGEGGRILDRRRGEDPFLEQLKARVDPDPRLEAHRRRRPWFPAALMLATLFAMFGFYP